MIKSKRIKELEIQVEALTVLMDSVIITLSDLTDENRKKDIQAGKWYKEGS
jgi:hypothetical protein